MVQLKLIQYLPTTRTSKGLYRSFWFSISRYRIHIDQEEEWADYPHTPLHTVIECRTCKKQLLECKGLLVSSQKDLGEWLIPYKDDLLAHSCVRKEREEPTNEEEECKS